MPRLLSGLLALALLPLPAEGGAAAPLAACSTANLVLDPGFDEGLPSTHWNLTSSLYGTPLAAVCLYGTCDTAGPRSEPWWVWFGGGSGQASASVTQEVTIPATGLATLTFYLRIGRRSGNGTDVFRVIVDDVIRFQVLESAAGYSGYTLVSLDISGAADGGRHTLTFGSTVNGLTDFSLDDVAILSCLNEADVAPRAGGNGSLSTVDWVQVGRFAAALDVPSCGSELRRADCAPAPCGNGVVSTTDWVQAGRYVAALDVPVAGCGADSGGGCVPPTRRGLAARVEGLANAGGPTVALVRRRLGGREELALRLPSEGWAAALGFSLEYDPAEYAFDRVVMAPSLEGTVKVLTNAEHEREGRVGLMIGAVPGRTLPGGSVVLVRFARLGAGGHGDFRTSDEPVLREVAGPDAAFVEATFEVMEARDLRDAP